MLPYRVDIQKELGTSGAQERDWKGIGTALVVILMICLLIVCALVMFTPLTASSHVLPRRLNLSDMGVLRPGIFDVPRFVDGKTLLMETRRGLETIRADKPTSPRIVFEHQSSFMNAIPSADLKFFAAMRKAPNPGMNVMNSTYFIKIIDAETKAAYDLGDGKQSQQGFLWSSTGNDFVYVENNEIFYVKSPTSGDPVLVSDRRHRRDLIVHGLFDWLYMEEIFDRKRTAMWWSPSGAMLAFASYDNSLNTNVTLQRFLPLESYTLDTSISYPKVYSKRLPLYTMTIWHKAKQESKQLNIQLRDSLSYHYLFAARWVLLGGVEKLVTTWADRFQTKISITICDFDSATCDLAFEYEFAEKRWASPDDFHTLMASGDSLYFLLPHDVRDNSYQHVARLVVSEAKPKAKPVFVHSGDFDVLSITAIDEAGGKVYFLAAAPKPGQRHLYSAQISAESAVVPECITCGIENCTFQVADISSDFSLASVFCRGPEAPFTTVVDLKTPKSRPSSSPKWWHLLNDTGLVEAVEKADLPTRTLETIRLADGYEAVVRVTLPKGLLASKEKSKSVPVLVFVYGGPNSQSATEEFGVDLTQVISSQQHVAILQIDARGSGNRGWKYRSPVYGRLGSIEPQDQIAAISGIVSRYPFLDGNRVAVFGWSYGGFMTLRMVEEAPPSFFECAISVAPVVNFMYYDATYTERYMGDASRAAYEVVDVSRDVSKFQTTRLLLMHGLFDENVHFQNSAIFMEQLQARNIDFDFMAYPNQAHSISERKPHVHMKIATFLQHCFYSE
ncbi:unnamed protein product [Caenorhabditis auriculariae]|uniref:Uncharacterized protein n=1 Tax=Caenorhabditis auriculariae TaxID=2777116 RepID=A0A8S1GPG2_9PELO|nr:unnamed protein product [Caenorhabditis auriculariae]